MPVTIHPPTWTTQEVHGANLTQVAQHIEHMEEAGQTHWQPSYHVTHWNGNTIGTVQVDVHVSVKMPHWAGSATATPEEQAEWERFLGALRTHEEGHVDLVTQYLQYVDSVLEGVGEHEAARQWHDNLAALKAASNSYDAGNDHGRNEGTTINLPDSP